MVEVCLKYLEAGRGYDWRPLEPCIHGEWCRFVHCILNVSVIVSHEAEFVSLVRLVSPEKRAALKRLL